jgi:hypothetical protein
MASADELGRYLKQAAQVESAIVLRRHRLRPDDGGQGEFAVNVRKRVIPTLGVLQSDLRRNE